MRIKTTAKKIVHENSNEIINNDNSNDIENSEQNSCDNRNDISDNEVEFLVECRRDQEGNQFLLDGTLVIEPAAVDTSNEFKENQESTKEINFNDFIKEINFSVPETNDKLNNSVTAPRKSLGPVQNSISTTTKCTACNIKINTFIGQVVHKHPLMEVVLCSECIKNQRDEYFVIDKDDNKETLCRWCVEGGSLICCDFCPKSFCKTCIKRNLGRVALSSILGQDDSIQWKCFVCNPKPIEHLKDICLKVLEDIKGIQDKQLTQKLSKKPIPKRPHSKNFLNEPNGSPSIKIAKVTTPQSTPQSAPSSQPGTTTPTSKSGMLLSNMANFGTEWYMRNVKLRNIFEEIDELDSRSLLNAINATKKCVEAFYSDIRNLETEISKATTAADIPTVVSMFKSVYRHHIFNRFCQVRARVEEDRRSKFVMATVSSPMATTTIAPVVHADTIPTVVRATTSTLTINNVMSAAITPTVGLSNGFHSNQKSKGPIMASIDLTDDNDRPDDNGSGVTATDTHAESPRGAATHDEMVVDLCADDDHDHRCP